MEETLGQFAKLGIEKLVEGGDATGPEFLRVADVLGRPGAAAGPRLAEVGRDRTRSDVGGSRVDSGGGRGRSEHALRNLQRGFREGAVVGRRIRGEFSLDESGGGGPLDALGTLGGERLGRVGEPRRLGCLGALAVRPPIGYGSAWP